MLSARVAQNPTVAVSEGMKAAKNSAWVENLLGVLRTGPKPPAWRTIHHSSSSPIASMNGALIPSRSLMVSMPRRITTMFKAQKKKKQIHAAALVLAKGGHTILAMA